MKKEVPKKEKEYIKKKREAYSEYAQLSYVLPIEEMKMLPEKVKNYMLENHKKEIEIEFEWAYSRYFWEAHIKNEGLTEKEMENLEEFIKSNKDTINKTEKA